MPAFCTNCGAPLSSETGFCPSCGTRIGGEVAATPAPVAPPAYAPAPAYAMPPVAAYPVAVQPKGPSVLKVVFIVIAVIVGIGILGIGALAFIGYRAEKAIQVTNNGKSVSTTVPGIGTVTTGAASTLTEQDLGIPLYPGATMDPSASSTVVNGKTKVVQATYWTTDPVSSVTSFYQGKLGSGLNVMGLGDETIMSYGSGNNTVTMMLDSESGKTKMNVIHTSTATQ